MSTVVSSLLRFDYSHYLMMEAFDLQEAYSDPVYTYTNLINTITYDNDRTKFHEVLSGTGNDAGQDLREHIFKALGTEGVVLKVNGIDVVCSIVIHWDSVNNNGCDYLGNGWGGLSGPGIKKFQLRVTPIRDVGKSTLSPGADLSTWADLTPYTISASYANDKMNLSSDTWDKIATNWRFDLPGWVLRPPANRTSFKMLVNYYSFPAGAKAPVMATLISKEYVFTVVRHSNSGKTWYLRPPVELAIANSGIVIVSASMVGKPVLDTGFNGPSQNGRTRGRGRGVINDQRILDELES